MLNNNVQQAIEFINLHKTANSNLCSDTRKLHAGDIFLAFKIHNHISSIEHIKTAIENKACCIIADDNMDTAKFEHFKHLIPIIKLKDLYLYMGEIAQIFYNTNFNIPIIGVTGTNGKTSITNWLAQYLKFLDKKAYIIGTLGSGFLDNMQTSGFTTPDAVTLAKELNKAKELQADIISIEVSSHGLEQRRVGGIKFHSAVFTNLTQDHLDYHETLENYIQAKYTLFQQDINFAIINTDDDVGQRFLKNNAKYTIGYGINQPKTNLYIWLKSYSLSNNGYNLEIQIKWHDKIINDKIFMPILGVFNLYNLMSCIASLLSLDYVWQTIKPILTKIKSVAGRLEIVHINPLVIIDYAHTPDALQQTLQTLLPMKEQRQGKLLCVFGCGGNRDASKRAIMGKIASNLCNEIFITSDNPRFENPQLIIQNIISGINRNNYIIEENRKEAIAQAINTLDKQDILLIAGKGHEQYQEIQGVKYEFSDKDEALTNLEAKYAL